MGISRTEAGVKLARALQAERGRKGAVVIGLPKGGAVVGAKVAVELGLQYECVPVCRIGIPCFPEVTLGAIDPDGIATFQPETQITRYELTKSRGELAERLRSETERCRGNRTPVALAGRDLIVVDDAADSHVVAQAAAEYLRRQGCGRLVFATPVAADSVVPRLCEMYDEVVADEVLPREKVPAFYDEPFPTDDQLHECMSRAWEAADALG